MFDSGFAVVCYRREIYMLIILTEESLINTAALYKSVVGFYIFGYKFAQCGLKYLFIHHICLFSR